MSSSAYIADGSQDWILPILIDSTHKIECGDHDFCLSLSHYIDTDPTSGDQRATAGIEPATSSPGASHTID